jgi:hypothetical protein
MNKLKALILAAPLHVVQESLWDLLMGIEYPDEARFGTALLDIAEDLYAHPEQSTDDKYNLAQFAARAAWAIKDQAQADTWLQRAQTQARNFPIKEEEEVRFLQAATEDADEEDDFIIVSGCESIRCNAAADTPVNAGLMLADILIQAGKAEAAIAELHRVEAMPKNNQLYGTDDLDEEPDLLERYLRANSVPDARRLWNRLAEQTPAPSTRLHYFYFVWLSTLEGNLQILNRWMDWYDQNPKEWERDTSPIWLFEELEPAAGQEQARKILIERSLSGVSAHGDVDDLQKALVYLLHALNQNQLDGTAELLRRPEVQNLVGQILADSYQSNSLDYPVWLAEYFYQAGQEQTGLALAARALQTADPQEELPKLHEAEFAKILVPIWCTQYVSATIANQDDPPRVEDRAYYMQEITMALRQTEDPEQIRAAVALLLALRDSLPPEGEPELVRYMLRMDNLYSLLQ